MVTRCNEAKQVGAAAYAAACALAAMTSSRAGEKIGRKLCAAMEFFTVILYGAGQNKMREMLSERSLDSNGHLNRLSQGQMYLLRCEYEKLLERQVASKEHLQALKFETFLYFVNSAVRLWLLRKHEIRKGEDVAEFIARVCSGCDTYRGLGILLSDSWHAREDCEKEENGLSKPVISKERANEVVVPKKQQHQEHHCQQQQQSLTLEQQQHLQCQQHLQLQQQLQQEHKQRQDVWLQNNSNNNITQQQMMQMWCHFVQQQQQLLATQQLMEQQQRQQLQMVWWHGQQQQQLAMTFQQQQQHVVAVQQAKCESAKAEEDALAEELRRRLEHLPQELQQEDEPRAADVIQLPHNKNRPFSSSGDHSCLLPPLKDNEVIDLLHEATAITVRPNIGRVVAVLQPVEYPFGRGRVVAILPDQDDVAATTNTQFVFEV